MRRKRSRKSKFPKKVKFIPYSHLPLGQSQMVRSRYLENFALTTSLGVAAHYVFAINSIYDPNFTGIGHQPIGHDQMSAIFQNACVVQANINMKCYSRDGDEYLGFGIYFSEYSTNPLPTLSVQGMLEQGAMKWVLVPPSTTGGGGTVRNLNASINMKKFFAIKDIISDSQYSSVANNNPARVVYMHVIMWQPDGGATNATGSFYLTLDQLTVWTVPKNLAQS